MTTLPLMSIHSTKKMKPANLTASPMRSTATNTSRFAGFYTAYVPEIGYNEAKTLTVQVKQDDSGLYTLSDEDMQNIDTWIIEY